MPTFFPFIMFFSHPSFQVHNKKVVKTLVRAQSCLCKISMEDIDIFPCVGGAKWPNCFFDIKSEGWMHPTESFDMAARHEDLVAFSSRGLLH